MSKKIIAFVVLSTCLTACSMEPASPPAIVVPDQKSVEQQMEKNVEAKAEEYHVAPELSDDFIQQYLDMDSFEELRERTLEGIWITQDQANMTKDEINLWEQVSQAEGFTQYTSKDFEAKKQELNMILEDLAAEQQQTIEEYAESYHMSEEEIQQFMEQQAQNIFHRKKMMPNPKNICF